MKIAYIGKKCADLLKQNISVTTTITTHKAFNDDVEIIIKREQLSDHTKGVWKLFNKHGTIEIQDESNNTIIPWTGFDSSDQTRKERLANAQRIIACVNFCSELSNDVLNR